MYSCVHNLTTIHHSGYQTVLYPSNYITQASFRKAIHLLVISTKDSVHLS